MSSQINLKSGNKQGSINNTIKLIYNILINEGIFSCEVYSNRKNSNKLVSVMEIIKRKLNSTITVDYNILIPNEDYKKCEFNNKNDYLLYAKIQIIDQNLSIKDKERLLIKLINKEDSNKKQRKEEDLFDFLDFFEGS